MNSPAQTGALDPNSIARQVLELQAAELLAASNRLGESFQCAVRLLNDHDGKVVTTGLGKSSLVARKIAATLCSVGLPAVFVHPVDALHGDAGVYSPGDPTILVSNSGSTPELLALIPLLRERESPLIGILGRAESPLAKLVDCLLDASVSREADPHNLIPTSSCVVQMALGDALAVALMQARSFTPDDFGRSHPGGQLGRNLKLRVSDVMKTGDLVAWLRPGSPVKEAVIQMTQKPLGAACIVDESQRLVGLITDGDLRRALVAHDDIRHVCASEIMTTNPILVAPGEVLIVALRLMEDRPSQISVMPVVDPVSKQCLGLVRLHDILHGQPGLR